MESGREHLLEVRGGPGEGSWGLGPGNAKSLRFVFDSRDNPCTSRAWRVRDSVGRQSSAVVMRMGVE